MCHFVEKANTLIVLCDFRVCTKVRNTSEKIWCSSVPTPCSPKLAMQEHLLGTGDRLLAEASPYDTIWGIGYRVDLKTPAVPLRGAASTRWEKPCRLCARPRSAVGAPPA